MLLEKLRRYADRPDLHLPPPMYQKTPIRWLIDLDQSGHLVGNGFVMTSGGGKGKNDRGKEYEAPFIDRTSTAVREKLLADTGEYVLGIARDPKKQKRVDECHSVFIERVRACATETKEPSVIATLCFLEELDRSSLSLPDDFEPGQVLTFRIDGQLPIELPSVQAYWAATIKRQKDKEPEMQCLICGEFRPPVKRLPFKIKGIRGGQSSGMALISANAPAFESYGLEESLIAPTCQDCGEQFSKAANALIQGEDTHIAVGPLMYLFWTKEEVPFSVASLLSRPQPDDVRALISSAFKGRREALAVNDAQFYATALSASGGRVVVRDWLETTVRHARQNLARYFALQQIVKWDGSESEPFSLFSLATSTVREARELQAHTPQVLLYMALRGGPLPPWLLFQAVKRNRAEQKITRPRAALIKMVLLSQSETTKEDTMVQLDPSNDDPAYLCGRLFAVLEAIQRAALGRNINRTITDSFFGTASSAPASVFGRLVRGSQAHLAKLRKEKRSAYKALQSQLEEVQAKLKTFPRILKLEDQGRFGLGYYHQRAADNAAAVAASSKKKSCDEADNGSEGSSELQEGDRE